MSGEIDVIDNAVPRELIGQLDRIVRMPIWRHGNKTSARSPFIFWSVPFADNEEQLQQFSAELFQLWQCVKQQLKVPQTIESAYANGQTYGQPGEIHTDSDARDHKTVVYYCNAMWQPDWHGETLFYTADHQEIIRAVVPKPGRLVIFNSSIPHVARDPSRLCALLRVTVTFKLRPVF